MKRFPALILALCLALSLSACGDSSSAAASTTPEATPTETGTQTASLPTTPEVDKNILTVDITLPSSYYSGQDMSTFDFDAYASENGFNSAVLNEDGSVLINMSKSVYRDKLAEMAESIESSCTDLIGGENTEYIKAIDYNDDYTAFTVSVDKAGYEEAMFDMTPLQLSIVSAYYLMFAGTDISTVAIVVNTIDADTGETLDTYSTAD